MKEEVLDQETEYVMSDATPDIFAGVNQLAVEAWQVLREGYDNDKWESMINAIGKMTNLVENNGELIVIKKNGEICGAVVYMPPGSSSPTIFPEGYPSVRMLVVHPKFRSLGIGRRLMNECSSRARRDQAEAIGLHTSPIMKHAVSLYEAMGYKKDQDLDPISGAPYVRYILNL